MLSNFIPSSKEKCITPSVGSIFGCSSSCDLRAIHFPEPDHLYHYYVSTGDVVWEVFSHLEFAEDLVMASHVCKSWLSVSKAPNLWKKVYLQDFDEPTALGDIECAVAKFYFRILVTRILSHMLSLI
jgi:hypothetical protein